eukprot:Ihof_evm1s761 gene=Ihof_evmTU1s761
MHYFEEYLESIETLAPEVHRILNDIKENDIKAKSIIDKLDRKIQNNFTRNKGYPENRETLYQQICTDYQKAMKIGKEKVVLASEAFDLIDRHCQKLQNELRKFQTELEHQTPGIIQKWDQKRGLEVVGEVPVKRARGETPDPKQIRKQRSVSKVNIPEISVTNTEPVEELGEPEIFCICQRESFGEMVACDNPH